MKKVIGFFLGAVLVFGLFSCERVAPNYYGVLMENFGKSKSDYSRESGRVYTMSPGTELFQVPAWEQRAQFTNDNGSERTLILLASDNTEFTAKPVYSYKVIENKVVDLVFMNARLGSGENFMRALEDNVLEPRIYDIIKEESRRYTTDTLMAKGGSLRFEERVQEIIKTSFEAAGLELITFSSNVRPSEKVKSKIDTRNEVNTNISVLDQQIAEQRKRNELVELQAQENIIRSRGITPELLQQQAIERWNGRLDGLTWSGSSLPFIGSSLPFIKAIK